MIEHLIPIVIGVGILAFGLVFFHENAHHLFGSIWLAVTAETDVTSVSAGERVKITGTITEHPDYEAVPMPFTSDDNPRYVYLNWSVEEGIRRWEQIADGKDGVSSILTVDGYSFSVPLDKADQVTGLSRLEPTLYLNKDDQGPLHTFLQEQGSLDVTFEEWGLMTRRVRYTLIEPGDEITIVGTASRSESSRGNPRFTIGASPGSVFSWNPLIVTDWERHDMLLDVGKRIVGILFSTYLICVGVFMAVIEFVTVPFSHLVPGLFLGAIAVIAVFIYSEILYYRLIAE